MQGLGGVGMHLAAWAQASDEVAVGLTYKSRTRLPLSGGADFTVPDAFLGRAPDQQASTDVLDRGMAFITEFSGKEFQSRRFLMGLIGFIKAAYPEIAAHLAKQQEGGRILLANDLSALSAPPAPSMPAGLPHTHGPGCQHHH